MSAIGAYRPVSGALHTVVETPEFQRRVRDLLTEEELKALIDHLAAEPDSGVARKLRWRAKGMGKRGGIRVITFYSGPPVPVFVLSAFGKGKKIDLSQAERNELRGILSDLVHGYLEGARRHVQGR
jgi:hypothetical protein